MIKKRSPIPFETIAAAIAFSPRIEGILCEVHRLAHLHRARLILIHIGIKTAEKQKKLDDLLLRHNFGALRFEVVWRTGETVESILRVCKENVVDLLIAGALERESILKYYIGSISREICRKAKCSVLMLTEPSLLPKPIKNIIVNGIDNPKTPFTIETAVYMAKYQKANELTIVKELNMMTMAMNMADDSSEGEVNRIKQGIIDEGNAKIAAILKGIDKENLNIKTKSITGKLGYSIGNYAAIHEANLLVIIDRLFPHDIEYILEDLPCNLLIVHSRH
jgi:nucleotide-binding universal stress UspA family protein